MEANVANGSKELMFGHVLVLGDVEICELFLKVDSLDLHQMSILSEDGLNHFLLFRSHIQVLSSG